MRRRIIRKCSILLPALSFCIAFAQQVLAQSTEPPATTPGAAGKSDANAAPPMKADLTGKRQSKLVSEVNDIKIEKTTPTVERREFNPWIPFTPQPKLEKGQKAFTEFAFKLKVAFDDIDVLNQEDRHGRWFVKIKPKNIRATMSLPIVIWLPPGAPQKCIRHEEGHRMIAERVYSYAGDILRYYANQTFSSEARGEGASAELAIQDAYKRAINDLNQNYRGTVFDYALMVTQEYDRLTNHGLNPIKEEDAINQSFEKSSSRMTKILEERAATAQRLQAEDSRPVTKLNESAK